MTVRWEDVDARARGLASHLLSSETLAGLAGLRTLQELSRALAAAGVLPEEVPAPTAAVLELALRRWAAGEVRVARRWLGSRAEVIAVALEVEDRRSLRALVRGAAAGVHAEARLTGLVPTPTLPERLLRELAGRSSLREQAALLVMAGHPSGPALLAAAAGTEPDLFAVELALSRAFAERATRGARSGGRFLRTHVEDLIDAENCRSALLLANRASAEPTGSAFIPGGRRLTLVRFAAAATAADPVAAARRLGEIYDGGPEAEMLLRHAAEPAALETAMDRAETERLHQVARLDPLGPAPLLLYLRRLRHQMVALGELVWALDLGVAPPAGTATGAGAAA
jgi:vacuolar-type H+-ATPase subunit C/Vma6